MRAIVSSGNQIVDAIGQIEITGNIVPTSWFKKITLNSGRPDTVAIVILSELLYWYRPAIVQDEDSGHIRWEKKFKADYLQKRINELAEKFNFSYDQVKNALNRLEAGGYIIKHLRNEVIGGTKYGNVLYIEIVPHMIKSIMADEDENEIQEAERNFIIVDTPQCIKTKGSVCANQRVGVQKPEAQGIETLTNTKSTTKNTTKDYSSIIHERERFREQIDYNALLIDHPHMSERIDEIVEVAVDTLTSSKKKIRVDGEERPIEFIRERFEKLNIFHMKYVLESLSNHTGGITNVEGFIRTTLFKAPVTIDTHTMAQVNRDFMSTG